MVATGEAVGWSSGAVRRNTSSHPIEMAATTTDNDVIRATMVYNSNNNNETQIDCIEGSIVDAWRVEYRSDGGSCSSTTKSSFLSVEKSIGQ